jgi:hypothetical protein
LKAVAVALTFGRRSLSGLLAQLERQTRLLPVLLWVDDQPALEVAAPHFVHVEHGARVDRRDDVGGVRRLAMEAARARYELRPDDVVFVLDDDDFYCSRHFEMTLAELGEAQWTGALAMGLQLRAGGPVEYVHAESGVGQHATWAYRIGLHDAAGGYYAEYGDDVELGRRMGWANCRPHWRCTHVRRQFVDGISARVSHDRDQARPFSQVALHAAPAWSVELEVLERWCAARLADHSAARGA